MRPSASAGMPRPASATSIATAPPSARPPTRTTLPRGEYLIAFERRFVRMRSSASGSGVDVRQRRLARDRDRVRCGPLAEEIDRRHDGWLHREGNATQRRFEAALDPREVEQVADDPAEALGLAAHDPGEPTHFLRRQSPQ